MAEVFSDGLFLPAMVLALFAWVVPKLLSMLLPEGVRPLLANALLSTFILFALSGALFLLLYVGQGVSLATFMEPGWAANIVFFCRLGLSAAIIWVPILVLSVAGLPRTWKTAVW